MAARLFSSSLFTLARQRAPLLATASVASVAPVAPARLFSPTLHLCMRFSSTAATPESAAPAGEPAPAPVKKVSKRKQKSAQGSAEVLAALTQGQAPATALSADLMADALAGVTLKSTIIGRKPTTPSNRFTRLADRSMLWKGAPYKPLLVRITRSGGRNHSGRITIRHRGGGGVRKHRVIDFKRSVLDQDGTVERLEYDPARRAHIALVHYAAPAGSVATEASATETTATPATADRRQYILAAVGMKPGDVVRASRSQLLEIKPGNAMVLEHIPVGSWVHNIEITVGRGGQICRAAGTTAQVLEKREDEGFAVLRFRSREHRMVSLKCLVTIGAVSNPDAKNENLGKAGRRRWRGQRPQTRGTAMNPIDHPHGGGHGKDHGGRYTSLTPWGKPTKGLRTRDVHKKNKLIVKRRFEE